MPPLKGAILDKEFLPSPSEAAKTIAHLEKSKSRESSNEGSPAKPDPTSTDIPRNLFRKSGTSDILGRAAESPDGKVNNLMPGGTRHSAGGEKMDAPTWSDAVKTVSWSSFGEALQVPCIRQALLVGTVVGTLVGGALWVTGRPAGRASNGAFWTFMGSNGVTHFWCDRARRREKGNVRIVKEAWEEKRNSKKVEWDKYRVERLQQVEREVREQREKGKSVEKGISSDWWKRWVWDSSHNAKPKGREG